MATDLMALIKQKKADLKAASGQGEKTEKLKDKKNYVRILPSWRGDGDATFWHDFGQHFIKGIDGKIKAVYLCAERTFGKPCAVCDGIDRGIQSSGDDDVIKAMKDAKAKGRVLVNAIFTDVDPKKVVVLELPPTVFQQALEVMEEWGNVIDLEEGRDLIITRSGTGLNTEYITQPASKVTAYPASIMKGLHDLDEYVKQQSDEAERRALAAVNQVSGLLPAPGTITGDTPRAKALKLIDPDEEFEDLDDAALGEIEAASVAPKSASKATDDETDLDDLLAGLETD